MKQNFGVGEAQVRVAASVARQPALRVATYSAMHLAALKEYGAQRPDEMGPVPRYQREKARVRCQDLIRKLRNEVVENPELIPFEMNISAKSMLATATI